MVQTALKRLTQIVMLAAAQAFVCNHIHLLGYATPMIYVLLLCYIPINASRSSTMLWAFLLGLSVDTLCATPGQASASLTLAAFVQRPLLETLAPKERAEDFVASFRTLGVKRHFYFILILTCVQHATFAALEYACFFNATDLLLSLGGNIALSTAVMLTIEAARDRRKRRQSPAV